MPVSDDWAVELLGDQLDLDDAAKLFKQGSVIVRPLILPEKTIVAVFAAEFVGQSVPADVREVAGTIIDFINGLLFLHDGARAPLKRGITCQRVANKWAQYNFASLEGALGRLKGGDVTFSINGNTPPAKPPEECEWLERAFSTESVADVLTFLRGNPDWFDLYKVFEVVRVTSQSKSGYPNWWPSETELSKFTGSANAYRHAGKYKGYYTPSNAPLTLDQASSFITTLVREWLRHQT